MIRKTFVTFAAALLAVMLLGTNDARALLIDGFGDTQGPVTATSDSGDATCVTAPCTASDLDTTVTDTDLSNVLRDISVDITDDGAAFAQTLVATVDGGLSKYTHSQGTDIQGTSTIFWTFDDFDISGLTSVALIVDVLAKDLPSTGSDGSIEITLFTDFGGSVESATLSSGDLPSGAQIASYTIGDFLTENGSLVLTKFDALELKIIGDFVALDMSLDLVAIAEPATLALFGIGLLGLGFLSRRRKRLVA